MNDLALNQIPLPMRRVFSQSWRPTCDRPLPLEPTGDLAREEPGVRRAPARVVVLPVVRRLVVGRTRERVHVPRRAAAQDHDLGVGHAGVERGVPRFPFNIADNFTRAATILDSMGYTVFLTYFESGTESASCDQPTV